MERVTDPFSTVRHHHGDIWDLHDSGAWVVDPTNMSMKPDGRAVMGKGLSLQVAQRFPATPASYGAWLLAHLRPGRPAGHDLTDGDIVAGPIVRAMRPERVLMAPVKRNWRERADLALITRSLDGIAAFLIREPDAVVALPRLGCGAGGRDWDTEVKPLVAMFLDGLPVEAQERIVLVEPA